MRNFKYINTIKDALEASCPMTVSCADIVALAEKTRDEIVSGKFHPFTGPLNKQDGSVFLKEGEVVADGDLAGMNFYVEGVEGSLPK